MSGLERLYPVLNQDGFIGFVEGPKGKGKTDISLLLAEICYLMGFRRKIATNIKTDSYMVEAQITNIPDLDRWVKTPGRKLVIIDESGKHLRRLGFMSKKNQALMEIVQLCRHFDCGLIFITLASKFIDSGLLEPEVIDFILKKITLEFAKVRLVDKTIIKIFNVPPTSIKFNSKDIAELTLEKKVSLESLPRCCQVAMIYREHGSYKEVETLLKLQPQQIKQDLLKHLKHEPLMAHNQRGGIEPHESEPQP